MINLDTISAMLTLQEIQKKALRDIVDFTDATYEQYENCVCFDRDNPLALDDLNDDEHAYGVVLDAVIDEAHHDCYAHYDQNNFGGLVYVVEADDGDLSLRALLYGEEKTLELYFDGDQWHEV